MAKTTEDLLLNGFMDLITERPLDKITVQDIADYCCVNRNTFYYHYDNIYDLLEKFFDRQTKSALEFLEEGESLKNCMRAIIMFALDHHRAAQHLATSMNRDLLASYLGHSFSTLMEAYVEHNYVIEEKDKQRVEFIITFYRYAFVGMTMDMMAKDIVINRDEKYPENPEVYVDLILNTIDRDITNGVISKLKKKPKENKGELSDKG